MYMKLRKNWMSVALWIGFVSAFGLLTTPAATAGTWYVATNGADTGRFERTIGAMRS